VCRADHINVLSVYTSSLVQRLVKLSDTAETVVHRNKNLPLLCLFADYYSFSTNENRRE